MFNVKVRKNFSLGEEIANAVAHGVGALLAIAGMVLLIVKGAVNQRGALYLVTVILYAFTLLFLFVNSTLYHALIAGKAKNVYERFDHLSIYLLIAGTYMPFCLISVGGALGIVAASLLWALALLGVIFKAIWIDKLVTVHTIIFLTMGWAILIFAERLIQSIGMNGFWLLAYGGIAYSVGTLFFIFSWFKYHHFIWHCFVVFGALFHFFAVYLTV